MRVFVVLAFIGILASLASALVYLMRDKGTTSRTVNALTVRIGLSVALFLFVLFAHYMAGSKAQALDSIRAAGSRKCITIADE